MIRSDTLHAGQAPRQAGWGWTGALFAMLVLGGGNATMPVPRFLAELVAVAMLAIAVGAHRRHRQPAMAAPDWIVIALLALFAAHLLPLPPQLWTALPGRETAAMADRAVFGAPGWRPLSLDPEATWRALLMLLPALATYAAARLGDEARRKALLRAAVLAALAGIALAIGQLALRQIAPTAIAWLQPYPRGDYSWPIGFFTNHNHQATFLLMALPLAAAWLRERDGAAAATWQLGLLTLLVSAFALVTGSRSGAALLPLALAGTWLAARSGERSPKHSGARLALVAGALVLAGGVVLALGGDGLTGVLRRASPLDDPRFDFWPLVMAAAAHFWPFGSGIGTFLQGYEAHEPLRAVGPLYLNHAHNDFLEVLLEAGVPGLVLALAASWELARLGWRAWRRGGTARHRLAATALALPVLHSLVDYPLRTIAISTLLALAAALMVSSEE